MIINIKSTTQCYAQAFMKFEQRIVFCCHFWHLQGYEIKLQHTRPGDSKRQCYPLSPVTGFVERSFKDTWSKEERRARLSSLHAGTRHRIKSVLHSTSVWPIWEAYYFVGSNKFYRNLDRDLFTYRALSP